MKKSIFYTVGIIFIAIVACTTGLNGYKGNLVESLAQQEVALSKTYSELQAEIDHATSQTKKNHGLADFGTDKLTKQIANNFTGKSHPDELKEFFENKYPTIDLQRALEALEREKTEFSPLYEQWVLDFMAYSKKSEPNLLSETALEEHQRKYLSVKSGKGTKTGEDAYKEMQKFIANA